jgi:hypothetical protein
MYRDDAFSMARRIERLETELAEYRAFGAHRRQRVLIAVSVVSAAIAVLACIMLRGEAIETESLTWRLGEMRAQLVEAKARECRSDVVSPRPSPDDSGL